MIETTRQEIEEASRLIDIRYLLDIQAKYQCNY